MRIPPGEKQAAASEKAPALCRKSSERMSLAVVYPKKHQLKFPQPSILCIIQAAFWQLSLIVLRSDIEEFHWDM